MPRRAANSRNQVSAVEYVSAMLRWRERRSQGSLTVVQAVLEKKTPKTSNANFVHPELMRISSIQPKPEAAAPFPSSSRITKNLSRLPRCPRDKTNGDYQFDSDAEERCRVSSVQHLITSRYRSVKVLLLNAMTVRQNASESGQLRAKLRLGKLTAQTIENIF